MRISFLLVLVLVAAACGNSAPESPPVSITVPATTSTTSAPVSTSTALPVTTTVVPPTTQPTTTTTTTTLPPGSLDDLELSFTEVATGFSQPVLLTTPPADSRLFVVDQPGVIWVITGADPTVFLDISSDVSFQGEQGLLGLAFHPEFQTNHLFYVNYIANNGDTVVEAISAAGDVADIGSRIEILRVAQPASNHNGGMIAFGPDGNLWIGLGDGGGANDQFGHGQRVDTLLGSMVRITVGPDIDGYTIPPGNMEGVVWATGLRNPWRWAFDGDDLWIADVGQGKIEEVDVVDWTVGNPNFGWSIMEGTECFAGTSCEAAGLVTPVYEYSHSEGCSVSGGVVYRGAAIPELSGHFLFSDYCTGWIRSVDRDGSAREWLPEGTFSAVTAIGANADGEVYVLTAGGAIYVLGKVG